MSQPFPVPNRSISAGEGADPRWPTTISNSSARDWLKCSHSALDCSTPSASSNCLSSGTHDPHEVPACVHFFRAGTSQQPPAMASVRSPLVTLLHEQICAPAGSAPTPNAGTAAVGSGRRDQRQRIAGQLFADHRPQHPVRRRVADQDAAQQRLGVVGEHQLGVGLVDRVVDDDLEAVRRDAHRVAEAGHVDAEQLELGRHVGLGELRGAAEQPVRDHLGAGVAGPDQAVAAALDRGDLADRIDVGILVRAGQIGEHAAAVGDRQAGRRGPVRRAAARLPRRPPRRRR